MALNTSYNPFQQTPYQNKGRLTIAALGSVEKYDPQTWQINEELFEMKDEPYVKLCGEFWYCGSLYDGKILYPVSEFKQFMEVVKPNVSSTTDDTTYFSQYLSKRVANKLLELEIFVHHIGTEFGDEEDDEMYIKIDSI